MRFLRNILGLFVLLLFSLTGCGSPGDPFLMATSTTQVVGDAGPGPTPTPVPVQFLFNPEQSSAEGTLTAQVDETFMEKRTLTIEAFEIVNNFASIGQVRMVLNPNKESTATIYRLNFNDQLFGTHTMLLNLIVETLDQNLTYDDVMLASDTAQLMLAQILPTLGFFFMGEPMELQTLGLEVTIPAELIDSAFDPN